MSGPYDRLVKAFCKRYTGEWTKQKIQDEYNATWRDMKANFKGAAQLDNAVSAKIQELNEAITAKRWKLLSLLAKGAKRQRLEPAGLESAPAEDGRDTGSSSGGTDDSHEAASVGADASYEGSSVGADESCDDEPVEGAAVKVDACPIIVIEDSDEAGDSPRSARLAPRQEALKSEISLLQSKLGGVIRRHDKELVGPEADKEIRKTRSLIDMKQKELKHKQASAKHAREFRKRQRTLLMELDKMNADETSSPPGRLSIERSLVEDAEPPLEDAQPPLEDAQSILVQVIAKLAILLYGGSPTDVQWSEVLKSCKTLDQLEEALDAKDLFILKTPTYMRLLPKTSSLDAKRPETSEPDILAQADNHRHHTDQDFCMATVSALYTANATHSAFY